MRISFFSIWPSSKASYESRKYAVDRNHTEFENGEIKKQSGELKAYLIIPFPYPAGGTHPFP